MLQSLMTVTVASKVAEAEDIAVFELADPSGGALPPFSAGSHIDVEVAPGLVRQYSLCNNPVERGRYVIGVLKDPATRGGSAGMHAINQGASIRISEPRNHFALEPSAQRSVLLAGGIGITPLLCMAERLDHIGADFVMHYCSRSPSRTGFRARIAAAPYARRAHFHFDDGDPAQKLDIDAALGSASADTHVYVCGPSGFIDFVLAAAAARGFAATNVHREYFTAASPAGASEPGAFQVKVASTGKVIDVPPERSILDVLRDVGVELPSSCEQGVCGTCLVRVLEGVPDHRDCFLTNEERAQGDQLTPCCSRSKTALLVLDL
jgi:vanillate O-demethylase ferredoxin subunit